MPICAKCNEKFPNRIKIDGKARILNKRRYCLKCSPFGQHNTKQIDREHPRQCACGETDPSKFYGHKTGICGKCHSQYTLKAVQEKRKRAISHLGGKCVLCGYDKYYGSIDLHHIDPSKKDVGFANFRGWAWEKILKEIENCVPLCRTCHGEVHAGISKI